MGLKPNAGNDNGIGWGGPYLAQWEAAVGIGHGAQWFAAHTYRSIRYRLTSAAINHPNGRVASLGMGK